MLRTPFSRPANCDCLLWSAFVRPHLTDDCVQYIVQTGAQRISRVAGGACSRTPTGNNPYCRPPLRLSPPAGVLGSVSEEC